MTESEARIVEAMRTLIEANRDVRDELVAGERELIQAIGAIEVGAKITDTLRSSSAGRQRKATQDAFERVIAARHELRLRVIAVCRDEGIRPWEIAEWWGISRQRVDRYIQELKKAAPEN